MAPKYVAFLLQLVDMGILSVRLTIYLQPTVFGPIRSLDFDTSPSWLYPLWSSIIYYLDEGPWSLLETISILTLPGHTACSALLGLQGFPFSNPLLTSWLKWILFRLQSTTVQLCPHPSLNGPCNYPLATLLGPYCLYHSHLSSNPIWNSTCHLQWLYMPHHYQHLTAAAWILHSGAKPGFSSHVVPQVHGQSSSINSFWAELQGMHTLLLALVSICSQHGISTGHVAIGCNNKGVVSLVQWPRSYVSCLLNIMIC